MGEIDRREDCFPEIDLCIFHHFGCNFQLTKIMSSFDKTF
jgi:hypothetical protein